MYRNKLGDFSSRSLGEEIPKPEAGYDYGDYKIILETPPILFEKVKRIKDITLRQSMLELLGEESESEDDLLMKEKRVRLACLYDQAKEDKKYAETKEVFKFLYGRDLNNVPVREIEDLEEKLGFGVPSLEKLIESDEEPEIEILQDELEDDEEEQEIPTTEDMVIPDGMIPDRKGTGPKEGEVKLPPKRITFKELANLERLTLAQKKETASRSVVASEGDDWAAEIRRKQAERRKPASSKEEKNSILVESEVVGDLVHRPSEVKDTESSVRFGEKEKVKLEQMIKNKTEETWPKIVAAVVEENSNEKLKRIISNKEVTSKLKFDEDRTGQHSVVREEPPVAVVERKNMAKEKSTAFKPPKKPFFKRLVNSFTALSLLVMAGIGGDTKKDHYDETFKPPQPSTPTKKQSGTAPAPLNERLATARQAGQDLRRSEQIEIEEEKSVDPQRVIASHKVERGDTFYGTVDKLLKLHPDILEKFQKQHPAFKNALGAFKVWAAQANKDSHLIRPGDRIELTADGNVKLVRH